VSARTVYRDIRDLILAGTPIDGEAGVGYRDGRTDARSARPSASTWISSRSNMSGGRS
jgi:predicted DNA-binding transcriptional regulator YafY